MTKATDGPLETVTHKGSSVFIYETPTKKNGKTYTGHTLVYTEAGKRKRRFVTKLENARTEAKSIAQQLSEGTGHIQALSTAEVTDFTSAMKILRRHPNITLASVCQQFEDAVLKLGHHGSIQDAVATHLRLSSSTKIPE